MRTVRLARPRCPPIPGASPAARCAGRGRRLIRVLLPTPAPGPDAAVAWVRTHLGDLCGDDPAASPAFRGGQQAADAALTTLDLTGYAARRNEVLPRSRRGASRISPYVRHGLVDLPTAWAAAASAPAAVRPALEPLLRRDPDPEATGGQRAPVENGEPDAVWLTAESLGDADPAGGPIGSYSAWRKGLRTR